MTIETRDTQEEARAEPEDPAERYELGGWNLDELLDAATPDGERQAFEALAEQVEAFAGERAEIEVEGGASLGGKRLLQIVEAYEDLVEEANRLSAYGSLRFAADTQSEAAIAYQNRARAALTELQNRTLFFSLWWQGLDDSVAERLLVELASLPQSDDAAFFLRDLRRTAAYRLDEKVEQVINLKDADGIGGTLTVYSMLTNAFEFNPPIKGVDGPLTRDQLLSYAFSSEASEREAAYEELHAVFGRQAKVLAQIYVHRARDWRSEQVGLRGYSSPISVRNVANDLPDEAIEALLEAARESAPIFQRYFRRKAQWLGLEKLRRYDLYAPITTASGTVDYAESVELVLETFDRFHPRVGSAARRVFEQQHIDSQPRPGKKGGAFCATVSPRLTPWVLVNFSGRLRDVATIAHELGHAVHSMMAEHHSVLTLHPCLPLAETASVFGEILITDRLLAERSEPEAQRELLASMIDDLYATVLRQAYFVLFERAAHEAVHRGASSEELDEIYAANLAEQFGDSVDVAQCFRREWQAIPHIYSTPFYCYAYSFGQLLVLALYQRYLEQGDDFKSGYLRLLAHGGSRHPEEILREVEVDASDIEFWRGGVRLIEARVAQLEALDQ